MELLQIYFKKLNKSCTYFQFSLLDLDPGENITADSEPQPWNLSAYFLLELELSTGAGAGSLLRFFFFARAGWSKTNQLHSTATDHGGGKS